MLKLSILVGTLLLGWAFGWGAHAVGFGFFGAFLISGAGSILGCWAGWKLHQRYWD